MVYVMAGWRGMVQVMPAVLTAGVTFAVAQFITANFIGPALVDVLAALVSLAALYLLLQFWQPRTAWRFEDEPDVSEESPSVSEGGSGRPGPAVGFAAGAAPSGGSSTFQGFLPYIILVVFVVLSRISELVPGLAGTALDISGLLTSADITFAWPGLDGLVTRVPPIVSEPTPYTAEYTWSIFSAAGTVVLFAAIVAGLVMGAGLGTQLRVYGRTLNQLKLAILTIMLILAIAYVMNYSGMTSTLGLAFAGTGLLFPFFSAFIGWLGVVLTGSDTSANALFGPMQTITAQQVGVEPALAGATNSSGGVMGKMIDAQSIVVAAVATKWHGHEGTILRYVFWHSIVLACLVGGLVMLQAYVWPFTAMVVGG
jgi:L-lactate permease